MGAFFVAVKTILPLFLIIFIGLIFSKSIHASEKWVDILNIYALKIGFPALVVASLMNLEISNQSYLSLIVVNSVYIVFCMFLAYPVSKLFRFSKRKMRTLFIVLSFGNVAYLGIPVLKNTFGETILPTAAVIAAVYVFWLLTLGLFLVEIHGESKVNFKKQVFGLLKNPLLLSVFVGLLILLFKIQLPSVIDKTITLFADSVTAIVLFSLGVFLGLQKIGKLKDWTEVLGFVLVTMIVIPAIFYGVIRLSGLENFNIPATIIDAAMPLGLTPYALSVQYKLESTFTARIVVLATISSIIIIPLWMVFLG